MDPAELVNRIKLGDQLAMSEFYSILQKGVRGHLKSRIHPQVLSDTLHDIFLVVVAAIQHGEIEHPERLMGFMWTVVHRRLALYIDDAVTTRRTKGTEEMGKRAPELKHNPEQATARHEQQDIVIAALHELGGTGEEVLIRFYIDEQPWLEICESMHLSETQFRLLKNRSKAKFALLANHKLHPNRLRPKPVEGVLKHFGATA